MLNSSLGINPIDSSNTLVEEVILKQYPPPLETDQERFTNLTNKNGESIPLLLPTQSELSRLREFDERIDVFNPNTSDIVHPFTRVINKLKFTQLINPLVHIIHNAYPYALLRGIMASLNNPIEIKTKNSAKEVLDIRQILELGIEKSSTLIAAPIIEASLLLNELPPHVSGYAFSGLVENLRHSENEIARLDDLFPIILVYPSNLKPTGRINYEYELPISGEEREKNILKAYILPRPKIESAF